MDARTRTLVQKRAGHRCEYCHIPEMAYSLSFHVEHIVASVHQRNDDPSNLAWACPPCNVHKGTNLATIDPDTGLQTNVFDPRQNDWTDHFALLEYSLVGLSPVGRGSIQLLKMNLPRRIELREAYSD